MATSLVGNARKPIYPPQTPGKINRLLRHIWCTPFAALVAITAPAGFFIALGSLTLAAANSLPVFNVTFTIMLLAAGPVSAGLRAVKHRSVARAVQGRFRRLLWS